MTNINIQDNDNHDDDDDDDIDIDITATPPCYPCYFKNVPAPWQLLSQHYHKQSSVENANEISNITEMDRKSSNRLLSKKPPLLKLIWMLFGIVMSTLDQLSDVLLVYFFFLDGHDMYAWVMICIIVNAQFGTIPYAWLNHKDPVWKLALLNLTMMRLPWLTIEYIYEWIKTGATIENSMRRYCYRALTTLMEGLPSIVVQGVFFLTTDDISTAEKQRNWPILGLSLVTSGISLIRIANVNIIGGMLLNFDPKYHIPTLVLYVTMPFVMVMIVCGMVLATESVLITMMFVVAGWICCTVMSVVLYYRDVGHFPENINQMYACFAMSPVAFLYTPSVIRYCSPAKGVALGTFWYGLYPKYCAARIVVQSLLGYYMAVIVYENDEFAVASFAGLVGVYFFVCAVQLVCVFFLWNRELTELEAYMRMVKTTRNMGILTRSDYQKEQLAYASLVENGGVNYNRGLTGYSV